MSKYVGDFQIKLTIEKIDWMENTKDLLFGFDDTVNIRILSQWKGEIIVNPKVAGSGDNKADSSLDALDEQLLIKYIVQRLGKFNIKDNETEV